MAGIVCYSEWRPGLYVQVFNAIVNRAEREGAALDTRKQNRIKRQVLRLLENRMEPYLKKLAADCLAENKSLSNVSPDFSLEVKLTASSDSALVILSSDDWDDLPGWELEELSCALYAYFHDKTMWIGGSADYIMFIQKMARDLCTEINDGKIV